jgi:hypothetical protein
VTGRSVVPEPYSQAGTRCVELEAIDLLQTVYPVHLLTYLDEPEVAIVAKDGALSGRTLARHDAKPGPPLGPLLPGGDEFVVLVPHGTETTMAPLAEALRDAIEQIVVVEEEVSYSVGASVGVSTIEAEMATSAMSDADAALYRDKAARRSRSDRSGARVMPRTLAVGFQEGEGRESAVPPIVPARWVTAVISHPPARRPRCSVLGSPPGSVVRFGLVWCSAARGVQLRWAKRSASLEVPATTRMSPSFRVVSGVA